MHAVKQPVALRNFDYREALKMLFLSDELWLIICVAILISYFVVSPQNEGSFYKRDVPNEI